MTNTEASDILKKFVMGEYDGTKQALDEAIIMGIAALDKEVDITDEMFQELMKNTHRQERRTEYSTKINQDLGILGE